MNDYYISETISKAVKGNPVGPVKWYRTIEKEVEFAKADRLAHLEKIVAEIMEWHNTTGLWDDMGLRYLPTKAMLAEIELRGEPTHKLVCRTPQEKWEARDKLLQQIKDEIRDWEIRNGIWDEILNAK